MRGMVQWLHNSDPVSSEQNRILVGEFYTGEKAFNRTSFFQNS